METERKNIITSIEIQKNNSERVNVYVDGSYLFSCDAELVYSHGLKTGKQTDAVYLLEIVNEDNYIRCKNEALRMVEKSYKSEREVYDKLAAKGYDQDVIEKVMSFLKAYDFLNDDKYTQLFIKEKSSSQGRRKIKYDLLKKGIDNDVIEDKLEQINPEAEIEAALALAERKLKILDKSEKDLKKIYKKLGDFLIRRGYSYEEVKKVLNIVLKKDLYEEE